jgi:hypothetical protein
MTSSNQSDFEYTFARHTSSTKKLKKENKKQAKRKLRRKLKKDLD